MILKTRYLMLLMVCGVILTAFGFTQSAKAEPAVCPTGSEVTANGPIVISGQIATGTFTVAPGCENILVSIASYKFPSATELFPQVRFERSAGTFDAGESFILRVNIPSCSYQVDLVVGNSLSTLAAANDYGSNLLSTIGGSSAACGDNNQPICSIGTDAIIDHSLVLNSGVATGTFSIAAGCENIPVSLASYQALAATFQLPQTLFDSATGTFDAGGPYTLQVDVDDCFYQVDLVYGPVIVNLSDTSFYGNKKVRFLNGGTQSCTDVGGVESGANITVTKVVVNDNGGTAKSSDFLLKVGQAVVTTGVQATNFPAGTYQVVESEGPLSGYKATFSGDCDAQGNITMAAGKSYTCTITNNDVAPPVPTFPNCIDLLRNPGDIAHYTSGLHQIAGAGLLQGADDVYTVINGAVQCFCPPTGMGTQTNWWQTDTQMEGWLSIGNGLSWNLGDHNYLALNSQFNCHPDQGGGESGANITVTKVVVNDNGGTAKSSDFLLKVGQAVVTTGVQATNFPAGTYQVVESEGPLSGYKATFSGDCDAQGNITMAAGKSYTCTITNNDIGPVGKITVKKVVVNDNGGTSVASDFTLKVNNTVVINGTATSFDLGAYTVTEAGGPSGYTATFSGDCNANGTLNLNVEDDELTCTITNNDNPPAITGGGGGGGSSVSGGNGGGSFNQPILTVTPIPVVTPPGQVLGISIPSAAQNTSQGVVGGVETTPAGGVAAGKSVPVPLLFALAMILIGVSGIYLTKKQSMDLE